MFGLFAKKSLGIDIGASSIKVADISKFGKKIVLENYAEFRLPVLKSQLNLFQKENLGILREEVADILESLLKRAKIKKKKVALSLPDFATFFTTFELPPMAEDEVSQAIEFEARHHIPVPLSEVTFEWQIIKKEEVLPGVKLKILLVAVPNQVLQNYQKIASLAGLEVEGMEAEVFGLMRSSLPKTMANLPVALVDVGWESTTVSIADQGFLKASHTFDVSGKDFTFSLSNNLKISEEEAENIKTKYGLSPENKEVFEILSSKARLIGNEIETVCENFEKTEEKKVENIVISGGIVSLFGFRDYLAQYLKKNIYLADPFFKVSFPPALGNRLKELAPYFGVVMGVALRGLED